MVFKFHFHTDIIIIVTITWWFWFIGFYKHVEDCFASYGSKCVSEIKQAITEISVQLATPDGAATINELFKYYSYGFDNFPFDTISIAVVEFDLGCVVQWRK